MSTYFFSPRTTTTHDDVMQETWSELEKEAMYIDYTNEEIEAMEREYFRDQQWREDQNNEAVSCKR